MGEPGEHALGELREPARGRIERLVGVEVDRRHRTRRRARGRRRSPIVRSPRPRGAGSRRRGRLRRRAPRAAALAVRRPGDAGHRPAAQRDDLDVDHVGDASLDLEQRLDAAQPVLLRSCRRGCGRRRTRWWPSAGRPARRARSMSGTSSQVAGSPPSPRSRPSGRRSGSSIRSARNALSRWAWGSTADGEQQVARRGRRRRRPAAA